ncbi:MAG: ADP-ribosylglycohydrolase family protein [Deltaproteobacteria bacterium]|nr:ADP-ribosylglycohydrolase family protein [Deltaproteobacteria bacterium]
MNTNARAAVLASFAGDAHALGAHWIYDTERIEETFGRVESLVDPPPSSFHANRKAGEFTHYGDQTFVLLESVAQRGGFHLDDFWNRWQELFASYDGYIDQATRATLRNARNGSGPEEAGSFSDDLAGGARIAPLVLRYADDREALAEAVRAQTRMTHNNFIVIQSALFFAYTALSVLEGASPRAAVETNAPAFVDTPISQWVREGLDSRRTDSVETIRRFGQTCHTEHAFPSIIHIISRYENDLKEALIQSVMAGGDSAGRNLIVGMILGAHLGMDAIPEDWLAGMKKAEAVRRDLNRLSEAP